MGLALVTAPTIEPFDRAALKAHLRLDASVHDDDDALSGLIQPAREYFETFTHRAALTQTWDHTREAFPGWYCPLELPKPPLISVTSVSYVDANGSTQTWSAALYTVLHAADPTLPGSIVPIFGGSYPVTRDVPNAVTVRLVAGYGAAPTALPTMAVLCMKEYARAHWGRGVDEPLKILAWVDRQLWPFKAFA